MDHELSKAAPAQPTQGQASEQLPRLFVGGLKIGTTREQLADYFSKFGPIATVEICGSPNGRSKLFGYVTFLEASAVDRVLSETGLIFEECLIRVARAMNEETRRQHRESLLSNRVFLSGIPEDADVCSITNLVSRFGRVKCVTKMRLNNKNKLFCCVTLETVGQADLLLRHKTLPFRQAQVKVKKFTPKRANKPAAVDSEILSDDSSVYGEDEIDEEQFVPQDPDDRQGYWGTGAGIDSYLSKKQKRRIRLGKCKKLEAFLMEQQALQQFCQAQVDPYDQEGYFEIGYQEQAEYHQPSQSVPNTQFKKKKFEQQSHNGNSTRELVGGDSNMSGLQQSPKTTKSYPFMKYAGKRLLLQSAGVQRKEPARWELIDIALMQPKQLLSIVSTSCGPSRFADSMNLKFNLRLD